MGGREGGVSVTQLDGGKGGGGRGLASQTAATGASRQMVVVVGSMDANCVV